MPIYPLRKLDPSAESVDLYDRWLAELAEALERGDDRWELCRRTLTGIYYHHLADDVFQDVTVLAIGALVAAMDAVLGLGLTTLSRGDLRLRPGAAALSEAEILREIDRRLHQILPRLRPVLLMHLVESRDRSRHAGREVAGDRFVGGVARGIEIHVARRAAGRSVRHRRRSSSLSR